MNLILSVILFSQLSTPYETQVFLDADGTFLIYARYYQGEFISIDSVVSVDKYLDAGLMLRNREVLLHHLKRGLRQQGGYASQGLFGTFEIPLPKGGFSDFMGETGKLDVGGHVKITIGGSETFISNLPGVASDFSWLPELEMKQEMSIKLDGEVGDRMRVYIDHNSERINETENKITVTYRGREDEIIQEIEGGDTDLSIPATTYTGDIPSHRGLFGIKSLAKLGPLNIVAIASKEQTQTQEIELEGSTQAQYDTTWAKYYERRRFFFVGTYDSIVKLKVYVDDNNASNNNQGVTFFAHAYLDINDDNIPDDTTIQTNRQSGSFTEQQEGDFYFRIPPNMIELNYQLPEGQVLGVWYVKINSLGQTDTVGIITDEISVDTMQLKLICPDILDTLSYTWHYEKKNYYQVVAPGSKLDSLRIFYITSGGEHIDNQNGVPFIQLLGLDNDENNLIDENVVFFQGRGLLIFPDSMPFASAVLENPDVEIYTNPYMTGMGKYYLYKKSMQAKAVFMLPDNVKKVTVFVDEVLQDSIKDYHVDYDGGILEFRKPILPTQKVRIKVEYAPFFSAAEKSLVGLRSSLRPFGDAMLGSSFFYRAESYPMDHVRLKEEPFNRMVWEVDFSYPQNLPVITKVIDWLPLIETETPSMMSVNFEGAYSFSNLNTKDEVFLDDLESSTVISNDISVAKISWSLCSKPIDKDTANFVQNRMIWYNPGHEDILQADDIYEDPLDPNEAADVLKMIFHPDHDSSFGGLTQYIYSENFEDIENLELIIKGKGGVIHIDFAQEISEDQLRRNQSGDLVGYQTFDDEDKDNNNVWNQGTEDTGLDGVYGDDDDYAPDSADDGNDDYQTNDYTGGINGSEGNALWDTEDLDRDGNLKTKNRYFSYSVDIDDTTSARYIGNAGLTNGWKMFRVAIKDSLERDTLFGQPDWRDIKYVRISFDGFAGTETLMIYKLSATGSRWKNYGFAGDKMPPPGDPVFTLTPVNTKTHSYYRSPYPEEYDQFGQPKSEGGLEFMVENVPQGFSCVAHRRTDENEDYRAYDTLTFYLYARNLNPFISIRLGSDSLNFYEYTSEYENGELGFNDYRLFEISMQSFIDLKRDRDPDADTISDSTYTVVGNPSLSNNRFFEIRISNQYLTPLTDTIWFNDIKLKSPKSEVGRIIRGNGSLTLADLASLNFAYDESNGRFKRLSESKDISTTSASQGYSVSGNVSLDKFLPSDWHFKIPVAMSFRKNTLEPRFSYYSDDVEIEGEDREEHKSRTLMRSYTIGFSKSQSKNWALRNTIDRLTFNHDRTQVYSRSVLNADTSEIKNFRGSYTLAPKLSFTVLKQKFFPLPKNISFNAIYSDNLVKSYHRSSLIDSFEQAVGGTQYRKTLTPSFSAGYSPHSIINSNYSFEQTRDSVFASKRYGEEVRRNQNFNTSFSPNLRIVTPRFTFNSTYSEDFRFEIRQDQNLRNVNNSGTYGVDGAVKVGTIVKLFTRLRDETKDTLNITGSPGWIAKKVEKLAGYIQNVQFNYSRQRSSSYLNVKTRPDIDYQWGLVDSIPPEDVALGSFPGRGVSDNYGLSSGFNYTSLFSASGGYSGSVNRTYNYGGGQTKTDNVSYPNLNIRLMKIESLPFLKKWCRHSSVMTNFNQTFEERYDVVADSAPDLVSDSKRLDLSPVASWQASWIKGISTTLEINYSETNSRDYYADTMAVESRIITRGVATSFAYTFSAPKGINIPLLKGIKFSSNLSLNLNVSYNRTTNYYTDLVVPATNTSTLSSTLGLSYNFSSSITGGANFDYSQNDDMNSYQNTRRVGLNIWTNINF